MSCVFGLVFVGVGDGGGEHFSFAVDEVCEDYGDYEDVACGFVVYGVGEYEGEVLKVEGDYGCCQNEGFQCKSALAWHLDI